MGFKQGLFLTCVVLFLSFVSSTQAQQPPLPPRPLPPITLPTAVAPVAGRRVFPPISLPTLPQFTLPPLPRLALPPFSFGGRRTPPPSDSPGPTSGITSIYGVPSGAARIGAPLSPTVEISDPFPPSPMDAIPLDSPLPQPAVYPALAPVPGPGPALYVSAPIPGPSPAVFVSTQKSGADMMKMSMRTLTMDM